MTVVGQLLIGLGLAVLGWFVVGLVGYFLGYGWTRGVEAARRQIERSER